MTIDNCMLNMEYTQASSTKKKGLLFILTIHVVKEVSGVDQEAENQRLRFFNFE